METYASETDPMPAIGTEATMAQTPRLRFLPKPDVELAPYNPLIVEIDDVLNADECADWIARIEACSPQRAPITTNRGFEMRPDIRNNDRIMLDDPAFAARIFAKIAPHLPARLETDWALCGANERLRCYRYQVGEQFAPHYDGAFVRNANERSMLTCMIYLNHCEGGGETIFNDHDLKMAPRPGAALVFNHTILHEGARVTAGRKYAIRTDVMARRASGTA